MFCFSLLLVIGTSALQGLHPTGFQTCVTLLTETTAVPSAILLPAVLTAYYRASLVFIIVYENKNSQ